MNRRQFMQASAASIAIAAGAIPRSARAQPAASRRLSMPPLLDTRATGRLALTAQSGQSSFFGGPPVQTAGYNQAYLGPTILMQNGPLGASVRNSLQETVTVHWHGLLVPGEHDGGPHTPAEPGRSWNVDMQIGQQPATLWYHSHPHGATARHVYSGLAGIIHLTDGRDDERGLPSRYGIDDLTLIIQDRRFDADGRMVYDPDPTDILNGFHAGRIVVNGQADAFAAVPRGLVRLRLLNASNARVYTLHFNDRRPMHVIATDGGFLPRPRELAFLRLAPGERAEVLVDFADGPPPVLMSARGLSMKILEFAHDPSLTARIAKLPGRIAPDIEPIPDTDMRTRRFNLTMGGSSLGTVKPGTIPPSHTAHAGHGAHGPVIGASASAVATVMDDFAINGRTYDMRRIDFEVERGSTERWIVSGGAGVDHPFHIHGVQFRVASVGGAEPRAEDSGWKDMVLVTGETEIVVRFEHRAGRDAPFMYHCHILEHEDAGMMGQFMVV